jgi:hypothetical protein
MPIQMVAYTLERVPAVREFNQRLRKGGAPGDYEFPETPDPGWMPGMHLYLAVEDSIVRGGYILRRQVFSVSRETIYAEHYRLPLSEGVIDKTHAMLGLRLIREALDQQPCLYAMGMGGWEQPLPRMLKRMKWRMCEVPFHFKVVHPARFLRNIRVLRTSAIRRFALDAAAVTGAGWIGMKALGMARRTPAAPCDLAGSFAGWADEIWLRSRESYALTAVRDGATLDALYPAADPRFLRVRTSDGWAVALDTQMHSHKQFGDMRVGTIVDCMAPPGSAGVVIRAVASVLEQRGVDLIVSNQLHAAWSRGLLAGGFRRGPSNYLLALSPDFAAAAGSARDDELHFNRGDGDGPIHL